MTLLPAQTQPRWATTTTKTRLTPALLLCLVLPLGLFARAAESATPACPHPADLAVSDETIDSIELKQACNTLQTNDLEVEGGALLGVQSGDSVRVGYGTRVDAQGTLQVNVAVPDLSAITVGSTSVQALDKVYLSNMPPELQSIDEESLSLEVRYVDAPTAPGSPVLEDDMGVFFYAPFNPYDPTLAANVSLFFTAGNSRSSAFSLSVSPLPDSPGAMNATAMKLMSQIESGAALLGSSLQAIKQLTPAQTLLSPELMPLKYAYSLLDDNGRSGALLGVLDAGSGFLTAKERQFLDQLAGYMQLDDLAQQYIDVWSDELNNSGTLSSAAVSAAGPAPRTIYKPSDDPSKGPPAEEGDISVQSTVACIDNPLPSTLTPAQLSKFMTLATESAIKASAANAALLNASGAAVGISGSLFAAAGVVTAPVSAGAAAVLGGAFATHLAANSAIAGIYPRRFTAMTVDLTRTRFNLDYEEEGRYTSLNATAASSGWIADGALFDFAATALGFGTLKNAKSATSVGELFADGLRTSTIAAESSTFGVLEDGLLGVCPAQWTVDLSDSEWSTALAVNGLFSVAPIAKTYEPREAANDTLRFFPNPAKFGFQSKEVDRAVGVDDMQVKAEPGEIEIEPGDDVSISALVEFADDTRLSWNPGLGSWANGVNETDSPTSVTKTLKTPSNPDDYPFDVVISSLADRKLSSPSAMIEDKVTIKTASLRIEPDYRCMDPGDVEGFQAFDDEDQLVDVTWSVEGQGSVQSTGLGSASYTAPALGGAASLKVFVVATSKETSSLQGRAEVDVGACTCEWEVATNVGVNSGDYSSHQFGPLLQVPLALDFFNDSFTEGGSVFGFNFSAGQTGTFEMDGLGFQIQLSSSLSCTGFNDSTDPQNPVSVRLDIIENNGKVVRGEIFGTCGIQDSNNIASGGGLSPYIMTFRSNNRASFERCYVAP